MNLQQTTAYSKSCKCCGGCSDDITIELLQCSECNGYVHSKCLQRGSVPGSLTGDIFYTYKCADCSSNGTEEFVRVRMTWLQVISLVLYHLKVRKKTLARNGYFHWKIHIATFIDHNWDILFRSDLKRKKKWIGTISGTLSHYSPIFFMSGTTVLKEQGWWTLTYPGLPPCIIIEINEELMTEKQKCKESNIQFNIMDKLNTILQNKPYITESMLKLNELTVDTVAVNSDLTRDIFGCSIEPLSTAKRKIKKGKNLYQGSLLPTVDNILTQSKRKSWTEDNYDIPSSNVFKKLNIGPFTSGLNAKSKNDTRELTERPPEESKYFDFLCLYNTSLKSTTQLQSKEIQIRLIGHMQNDFILSPYSSTCLSPFIWRSSSFKPPWLHLMDELKCKVNYKTLNWELPHRASLDFTYVQPNHIPALNSLCSIFFWSRINLTDILQYPEYTCIALYKKLVVGFACAIPNVNVDEVYLSFIFTLPAWRKCGIAKFMLYHITQVADGNSITLHVSTTNPALLLFQRFGFKIQYVVKNFYEKYYDSSQSTDAFLCKIHLDI